MLYTQVYLLLLSVHFLYVHYKFCHNNVIQKQRQAECTMHGLYCYKQHDYHTNYLWMKIILSTGMIFSGMKLFGMLSVKSYLFWYELHIVVFAVYSYVQNVHSSVTIAKIPSIMKSTVP